MGSVRYPNTSPSDNILSEQDISYDRNGNLTALTRRNDSGTATQTLSYTYTGPKRSGWTYDNHGNVTADPQSGISVAWNAIDMPRTLTSGSASTQRGYLTDGTLAQIYDGSTTRLYLGDMVFTRSGTSGTPTLESAGWEGGRLINGSGTSNVLYYVTDHLGSVRVVKDGSGTIRQRFDYYPYGSVSRVYTNSSTTDNSIKRYRFGGKEIAGTSLTDLAGTGAAPGAPYPDFGARLYSPGTATWLSVDPMAEKYYGIGPLTYCAGNPVNLVDPEGDDWYVFTDMGDFSTKIEHPGKHRLVLSSLDGNGNQTFDFYDFADAVNDPKDIDAGIIDRVQLVSDNEIYSMIEQNEGFNVSQFYFIRKSKGDEQFDYSAHVLFDKYKISHSVHNAANGLYISKALYLPEGERVAHNYMNFGNFLWAVTGKSIGIDGETLLFGADINSLINFRKNGYRPQLDSEDDQLSISLGVNYAIRHNYRKYHK